MRNPSTSLSRLPDSKILGSVVSELLDSAIKKYPQLMKTAEDIIEAKEEVTPLDKDLVDKIRNSVLIIAKPPKFEKATAEADSPLNVKMFMGWHSNSDDPDAKTLAEWVLHGAPLGFDEEIERRGVFPVSTGTPADEPTESELLRDASEWENWPSALEEKEDLHHLIREAERKGFCSVVPDSSLAEGLAGGKVILNKLGVIVKNRLGKKKSRIIWDLRESKVNMKCDQSERIVLPRLLDLVHSCLKLMRENKRPILAAADIEDAFHNVPAGSDRRYTVALAPMEDGKPCYIVYKVLVFGSRSSPTIWGRYAAFLGRTTSAVIPEAEGQVYVDDPIWAIPTDQGYEAKQVLTKIFLWAAILGYPLKLAKSSAGDKIRWIGAEVEVDNSENKVVVSIPEDKVKSLVETCEDFLKRPVVGTRVLRSFAGSMAFVAGLVPLLRPFLSPLWAALSCDATDDGQPRPKVAKPRSRVAGKLVHTKRIANSLVWIAGLLREEHGHRLVREFWVDEVTTKLEVVTDASPWGMGGILYEDKKPVRWFATHLTPELLMKFGASTGDSGFNTLWEAIALLIACRLWLSSTIRGFGVRLRSDNVGALRTFFKLAAGSSNLNLVAREVALDLAVKNYRLTELAHIQGITNVAADALSRLWSPDPKAFPNLGSATKDAVPNMGAGFWRVS